jgi:hypothetical protein
MIKNQQRHQETSLAKWQTPKHRRNQPISKITLGSSIATGFWSCQSPRKQQNATRR